MGSSRASTAAGKRRAAGRGSGSGRRSGATARKRAPVKRSASKRTTAKRTAPKRTAAARSPANRPGRKRAPARRPPSKRARPTRRPRRPASRSRAASSWRFRLGLILIAGAALAAGYFLWLRDSSLVAVDDVEVVGVTGGDRARIVAELTRVGEGMTTLHVQPDRIEAAAEAFPTIESVSLDANFPHGLRIEVAERPPALLVSAGEREVPVAADGTLLTGVSVPEDGLPVLEVDQIPDASALGGEPLEQALVVGATPEPLRPLIERIGHSKEFGVEVTLRGEIPVRFGSGSEATEKWAAATAVLADPKLDTVTYVDVRIPGRAAAGGATQTTAALVPQA